jgi:hypothetical protein
MIHAEILGAMASSSRATHPIQAPCSSLSIHNPRNVGFEYGIDAPTEEPMESCQEHSLKVPCIPWSLCQQDFAKVYHISKRKRVG